MKTFLRVLYILLAVAIVLVSIAMILKTASIKFISLLDNAEDKVMDIEKTTSYLSSVLSEVPNDNMTNGDSPVSMKLVSSDIDYTYPTNDAGTHGARGYNGDLTDGIIPDTFLGDKGIPTADWFGLFDNAKATDGSSNTDHGCGEFIFDLGEDTELAAIKVVNGNDGVYVPPTMTVCVGDGKSPWVLVGDLQITESEGDIYWFTADMVGNTARYVRLLVTVSPNTYWAFISEIEIYAVDK